MKKADRIAVEKIARDERKRDELRLDNININLLAVACRKEFVTQLLMNKKLGKLTKVQVEELSNIYSDVTWVLAIARMRGFK